MLTTYQRHLVDIFLTKYVHENSCMLTTYLRHLMDLFLTKYVQENRCMLTTYFVLILAIFIGGIVGAVLIFQAKQTLIFYI